MIWWVLHWTEYKEIKASTSDYISNNAQIWKENVWTVIKIREIEKNKKYL